MNNHTFHFTEKNQLSIEIIEQLNKALGNAKFYSTGFSDELKTDQDIKDEILKNLAFNNEDFGCHEVGVKLVVELSENELLTIWKEKALTGYSTISFDIEQSLVTDELEVSYSPLDNQEDSFVTFTLHTRN